MAGRAGLPRGRLLFNASHTHCGPEVRPDKVRFLKFRPNLRPKSRRTLPTLEEKMTAVVESALRKLEPVVLRV